jgi:hypothetical protein
MSDWMSGTLSRQDKKLLDIVSEHQADNTLKIFHGINN